MTIPYDDFSKIDLRVGKIELAEKVLGSEKLLRLQVNLGEEKRQIIAGIGKKYEPETLIGKDIVVVANLEPRALMGLESHGMLLAADSPDGPVIITPSTEVSPGSKIK